MSSCDPVSSSSEGYLKAFLSLVESMLGGRLELQAMEGTPSQSPEFKSTSTQFPSLGNWDETLVLVPQEAGVTRDVIRMEVCLPCEPSS